MAEQYVDQLAPWRRMLALGLTSTPENPEPTRSDTHAWAAHPNYGLLATVLGVRPASRGFRTVVVAPALGPLRRAEGRVPHPRGDIDVALERVGAQGRAREDHAPRGSHWNTRMERAPGAAAIGRAGAHDVTRTGRCHPERPKGVEGSAPRWHPERAPNSEPRIVRWNAETS